MKRKSLQQYTFNILKFNKKIIPFQIDANNEYEECCKNENFQNETSQQSNETIYRDILDNQQKQMDEIEENEMTIFKKELLQNLQALQKLEWEDLDIFLQPYLLSKKRLLTGNVIWEILNSFYFFYEINTDVQILVDEFYNNYDLIFPKNIKFYENMIQNQMLFINHQTTKENLIQNFFDLNLYDKQTILKLRNKILKKISIENIQNKEKSQTDNFFQINQISVVILRLQLLKNQNLSSINQFIEVTKNTICSLEYQFSMKYMFPNDLTTDEKWLIDYYNKKQTQQNFQNLMNFEKEKNIVFKKRSECQICFSHQESEKNYLIVCRKCNVIVHNNCYSNEKLKNPWICDLCRVHGTQAQLISCMACPCLGGLLRRTQYTFKYESSLKNKWIHTSCYLWQPKLDLKNDHLRGLGKLIQKELTSQKCNICSSSKGLLIRCENKNCDYYAHGECANRTSFGLKIQNWTPQGFKFQCPIHRNSNLEDEINSNELNIIKETRYFLKYLKKFLKIQKITCNFKENRQLNFKNLINNQIYQKNQIIQFLTFQEREIIKRIEVCLRRYSDDWSSKIFLQKNDNEFTLKKVLPSKKTIFSSQLPSSSKFWKQIKMQFKISKKSFLLLFNQMQQHINLLFENQQTAFILRKTQEQIQMETALACLSCQQVAVNHEENNLYCQECQQFKNTINLNRYTLLLRQSLRIFLGKYFSKKTLDQYFSIIEAIIAPNEVQQEFKQQDIQDLQQKIRILAKDENFGGLRDFFCNEDQLSSLNVLLSKSALIQICKQKTYLLKINSVQKFQNNNNNSLVKRWYN